MSPIGGFFELESFRTEEYYPGLTRLNTSRNAFEYILRAKKYKKAWLPYYTCDVMLEPIQKLGIEHEFYPIDEKLNPEFHGRLNSEDCIVYNNYFGIKGKTAKELAKIYPNLIIDNAQAFFTPPIKGVDTIYSIRKFFGLPDGGLLQTDAKLSIPLEQDVSYERMQHLLKRIDLGPEKSYPLFVSTDKSLENNPIRKMSLLTEQLMGNINFKRAKKIREENFAFLHKNLGKSNHLSIDTSDLNGPMVYPFLLYKDGLREYLIKQKIFVAKYWPNTFDWCSEDMIEYKLAKYLVPLPIDQRYGFSEMKHILNTITSFI
jgi:hypothetical protein